MEIQQQLTIKMMVEKKVEIKLPFYCESLGGGRLYKVFSNKNSLEVGRFFDRLNVGINVCSAELAFHGGYKEITAEQFDAVYEEVRDIINGIVI